MEFKEAKIAIFAVIFFSIILPIGILVALGTIVSTIYKVYLISGTITFYMTIGTTLSIAQGLANERESGRLSLLLAAGISRELYSLSIAISNGLSALLVTPLLLIFGVLLFHLKVASPPLLVIAIISALFMGITMGMLIGFAFRTPRDVNQYSQIISFTLSFFAPVYFPYTFIPLPYRYLTLLEPTTYASQSISMALIGNTSSILWSIGDFVYGIIFLMASSYIIKKR